MARNDFSGIDFTNQGSQILEVLGTAFERRKVSDQVLEAVKDYTRVYGQVELIKYNDEDEPEDVTPSENSSAPNVVLTNLKLQLSEEYVWWTHMVAGLKSLLEMNSVESIKNAASDITNYMVGGYLRAIVSSAQALGVDEDWLLSVSSLHLEGD